MRATIVALAILAAFAAGVAIAKQPGPVILQLGPVVPTPAPSPGHEEHIRMITSFTLGNKPTGETLIAFEATDFGVSDKGEDKKYRTIATEQYTLVEPKPPARELRDEIMTKIRSLEQDLLKFAKLQGEPRVRESIQSLGGSGSSRP